MSIPNLATPKQRASVPHAAALVSKRVRVKSPPEKARQSKEVSKVDKKTLKHELAKGKVKPKDDKKVIKPTLKNSNKDKSKKKGETKTRPSALKKPSTILLHLLFLPWLQRPSKR